MCLLFSFNLVFPISGYFPSWPCPATCSTCSACQRPRASRSFRSSRSSPKQKEPRRARYVSKGKLGVLNMCQKENKHFDERETPKKSETGKGKREVHTVHCVLHSHFCQPSNRNCFHNERSWCYHSLYWQNQSCKLSESCGLTCPQDLTNAVSYAH